MAWKWKNGRARLATNKEVDSNLYLTEGDNANPSKVPQLESMDTFKTLWAYVLPSGTVKIAHQNLHLKSMDFAQKISSSF